MTLAGAVDIFEYLPLRNNTLFEEYILHLWNAFITLSESENSGVPFAIMPFHLLFMSSVQTVILRLFMYQPVAYKQSFTLKNLRQDEKDLLCPSNPFTIGLLGESEIANLLALIPVNADIVKRMKELIRNRNDNLAHAKGGIERKLDEKVNEYLDVLKHIFGALELVDNKTAEWLIEERAKRNLKAYEVLDQELLGLYLCKANFQHGKLGSHFGVILKKVI